MCTRMRVPSSNEPRSSCRQSASSMGRSNVIVRSPTYFTVVSVIAISRVLSVAQCLGGHKARPRDRPPVMDQVSGHLQHHVAEPRVVEGPGCTNLPRGLVKDDGERDFHLRTTSRRASRRWPPTIAILAYSTTSPP